MSEITEIEWFKPEDKWPEGSMHHSMIQILVSKNGAVKGVTINTRTGEITNDVAELIDFDFWAYPPKAPLSRNEKLTKSLGEALLKRRGIPVKDLAISLECLSPNDRLKLEQSGSDITLKLIKVKK